jgi:translation initiation factor IF-3
LKNKEESSQLINERIKAENLQLIDHNGENVGLVTRNVALKMAQEVGLDLVMLAEQGKDGVPVVKIMDFGKVLYERKKKKGEAKKHQKVIQVKEIKMRPKIGEHDYQTKVNQGAQFLREGKRVKITLSFKGRENIGKEERGTFLFDRIAQDLINQGFDTLSAEPDSRMGLYWSRIYYLKNAK